MKPTEEHKQAIKEWLEKRDAILCPFDHSRFRKNGLWDDDLCYELCPTIFPTLEARRTKTNICPCFVYSIKHVRRVARRVVED